MENVTFPHSTTETEVTDMVDFNIISPSNSTNNSTIEEKQSNEKIFTIVLYVLVGSIGIIGNSLVCLVFGLMRSRRSQVNLFIFHQAFVDLCTSCLLIMFGVTQLYREDIMNTTIVYGLAPNSSLNSSSNSSSPIDEMDYVEIQKNDISFGLAEFMCRFWWGRVFLFSMFVISTFNLMTMAIERYMAIMHPFYYATHFHRKHAVIAIALIWLVAPMMQYFPPIFQYHATRDTHTCADQPDFTPRAQAAIGVCLILYEFFMPCFIMGYSSVRIFRNLRRRDLYLVKATNFLMKKNGSDKDHPPTKDQNQQMVKANRNTTMVVIVIFIVYIVCWAPNHLTFLGFNLGMPLDFGGKWYQATVLLAFMNSCINPFIYAIRLKTFQRGFVHICRKGCTPMNSANFDSTGTFARYDVNASFL